MSKTFMYHGICLGLARVSRPWCILPFMSLANALPQCWLMMELLWAYLMETQCGQSMIRVNFGLFWWWKSQSAVPKMEIILVSLVERAICNLCSIVFTIIKWLKSSQFDWTILRWWWWCASRVIQEWSPVGPTVWAYREKGNCQVINHIMNLEGKRNNYRYMHAIKINWW